MPYGVAMASGLLSKTGRSLVSFLILFSYHHLFMGLLHPSVLPWATPFSCISSRTF